MSKREIKFCPYCGVKTENKDIHGEIRPVCPSCNWIHFTDPKVAAAVIVEKDGKILLTRRIYNPHKGNWTLPAGFVNAFEDPAHAAARECLEETGLQVQVGELTNLLSGREHPHGADIILVYKAEIIGGSLQPGDDADQVDFFTLDNLPPLAFSTTKRILGFNEE